MKWKITGGKLLFNTYDGSMRLFAVYFKDGPIIRQVIGIGQFKEKFSATHTHTPNITLAWKFFPVSEKDTKLAVRNTLKAKISHAFSLVK